MATCSGCLLSVQWWPRGLAVIKLLGKSVKPEKNIFVIIYLKVIIY